MRATLYVLVLLIAGCGGATNPTATSPDTVDQATLTAASQYCDSQIADFKKANDVQLAAMQATITTLQAAVTNMTTELNAIPAGANGKPGTPAPILHLLDTSTGEDLGVFREADITNSSQYGGDVAWTTDITDQDFAYDLPNCPKDHLFIQSENLDVPYLYVGTGFILYTGDIIEATGPSIPVSFQSYFQKNTGCTNVAPTNATGTFGTQGTPMKYRGITTTLRNPQLLQVVTE